MLTRPSSPRKNPNIATGDSPPKEVGDKASATFVSVGGDKLTLNLGSLAQTEVLTTKLIEVTAMSLDGAEPASHLLWSIDGFQPDWLPR